jgi:phosphoribosylformylglycinamidine synthase PurS subunit
MEPLEPLEPLGTDAMPILARVFVTLKPSVFDPQGNTITEALHQMGYGGVADVRQGKYFELELGAATADEARSLAAEVAHKLLANPVIESYRIEVSEPVNEETR